MRVWGGTHRRGWESPSDPWSCSFLFLWWPPPVRSGRAECSDNSLLTSQSLILRTLLLVDPGWFRGQKVGSLQTPSHTFGVISAGASGSPGLEQPGRHRWMIQAAEDAERTQAHLRLCHLAGASGETVPLHPAVSPSSDPATGGGTVPGVTENVAESLPPGTVIPGTITPKAARVRGLLCKIPQAPPCRRVWIRKTI